MGEPLRSGGAAPPLFRGTLGPIALERLGRIQAAHQRLDAEAGEVLATVAEAQGHRAEAGAVRFVFDLTAKEYAAVPASTPPAAVPTAPPVEQERSA